MSLPHLTWLAAEYHLPSLYSCRVPMSSMNSAPALPDCYTANPEFTTFALMKTDLLILVKALTTLPAVHPREHHAA